MQMTILYGSCNRIFKPEFVTVSHIHIGFMQLHTDTHSECLTQCLLSRLGQHSRACSQCGEAEFKEAAELRSPLKALGEILAPGFLLIGRMHFLGVWAWAPTSWLAASWRLCIVPKDALWYWLYSAGPLLPQRAHWILPVLWASDFCSVTD